MDFICMIVAFIIYGACLSSKNKSKTDKIFLILIVIEQKLLFLDICAWCLQGIPEYAFWNFFVNFSYFSGGIVISFISWLYQMEIMNLKTSRLFVLRIIVYVFTVFALLANILNIFYGFYFTVDFETGIYARGKYFWTSMIYSFTIFLLSMFFILFKKTSLQVRIAFLVYNLLPLCALLIQGLKFGLSLTYVFSLFSILIMYITLQVNLRNILNLANNKLMISQIQPHFLFNTLTTIQALCETDSELAAKTIHDFSIYLRNNINSFEQDFPIDITNEIEHVKCYSNIEMLRFNNIKIDFDIADIDFKIPALTIQPLVENAIRHGVRIRENGIVKIRTYFDGKYHIIEVEDNGKGFYPEMVNNEFGEEKKHIGLKNVQERIINMCAGKMIISSKIDEGTKITISIPEVRKNRKNNKELVYENYLRG